MAGRRIRRALARITVAALALATPAVLAAPSASAVSPNLVISQVYGGGGNSGAQYTHDYVELFNRGTAAASLAGMSIQYASATGTGNLGASATQLTDLPDVTLQPGQYYLVQQAAGAGSGNPLPTPDLVDPSPIAMSATAGKVVLATGTTSLGCNGGSTGCSAEQLARIVDLVGFGSANFFEGAAAPTLSNTTAALRAGGGCTDTDNNAADFSAAAPAPRTTSTALAPCGGPPPADTAPSVVSVNPQDGTTQIPVDAVTVTFSEPVTVAADAFSLTCSVSGGVAFSVSGGPTAFTLTPTSPLTNGDECLLSVSAAGVADVDTNDPPDTMEADFTSTFTVAPTLISEIQGTGMATTLAGQIRTVEAVVTAVKPGLSGFYLQEEDGDADADPATSEGIFVFGSATVDDVEVGQLVQVTGRANEFVSSGSSQTQLSNATVEVLEEGVPLPTVTPVTFPVPSTIYLERFEGMLVELVDELVISEYFNYDRFGEVVLAKPLDGQDRLHTPTAVVEPGSEAIELAAEQALRIITLDDSNSSQNPATIPHPGNGEPFSAENSFRGGDTVTGVVGVIDHLFGLYRIQPTEYGDYEAVNPRPTDAPDVGGSLQVASFNVLNYFLTLDDGTNDICGPSQNLECRGADSEEEFDRQRIKILEALEGLDADVVGLIEMENTPGVEPAADLVEGLNERMGAGTYDYIDTGVIGTDAIRLGFIYKPGTVTPVGDYAILDSSVDSRFNDDLNRPMLTQTFEEVATHARVTVSVNHLKSKGSDCNDVGDRDEGDGQGNCNGTRTLAAQAIADFLASDPTDSGDPDHLVIGDLNSYDKEEPIDALIAKGYTDLIEKFGGEFAYGYVFDGKVGYLDHALSNEPLTPQVTGAAEWHINADEPDILDYNLDFGRPATYFEPTKYRSSDHDPVLVGLDLLGPADFVMDLRDTLAGMDLQRGIANSLDAKLRSTLSSLDDGDTFEACESLQSFIDQVNALTGKKISAEDAEILIAEAAEIRRSLDC